MKPSLKLQGLLVGIHLVLLLASAIVFSHLVVGLLTRQQLAHPVWESLSLGVYLVCIFPFGSFLQRRMAHLRAIGEAPPLPAPEEMEMDKKKALRQRRTLFVITIGVLAVSYGVICHVQSNREKQMLFEYEQRMKLQEKAHQ